MKPAFTNLPPCFFEPFPALAAKAGLRKGSLGRKEQAGRAGMNEILLRWFLDRRFGELMNMLKTILAITLAGGFFVAESGQVDAAFAALDTVQQQQAVALAQIHRVREGK